MKPVFLKGMPAFFCLAFFIPSTYLTSVFGQTPVPQQHSQIPRELTLAQAEQLLLERNLLIASSKYQIDAARAAKLIASFKPNPVLTLGAEQLRLRHDLFHNLVHSGSDVAAIATYTVRIDKTIERGQKRELRTELADLQLEASEAQMLDAIRNQLFPLRSAFATAALARESLLLAETTLQQYEQTEKLTEIRVEGGDLAGVEIYRAKAGLIQYQQAVQQARTSYQQATRDILNSLGATTDQVVNGLVAENLHPDFPTSGPAAHPDDIDPLRDAPLKITLAFDDRPLGLSLEELRKSALENRPDVLAARRLFEASGKSIALAQAQKKRDISVGMEFQRVGTDPSVGVVVSIPLLRYNNHEAEILQAQSVAKSAEAIVKQVETQAITDVEKAYQSYQSARRLLDLFNSQNLKQVEKLKTVAAFSFKEGASSLLELLDAQRSYNQTIGAYNQARSDYQMALWQLEQAVGKPLR